MLKKLLGLIFNEWVLAAVGLTALGIVIWIVGPLVQVGPYVPLDTATSRIVLIAAIVLLWLVSKLWRLWRARHANTAVVNQLIAQAPAPGAPDAASAELATIRERFQQALTTLKQARFGAKRGLWASASAHVGQRYLYELPWYVIIGAPGSGKTTALLNSGLEFPLAASMGEAAIRGVGGTRHCDWWFTTEAVLIDTAGRYTTQDSDKETDHKAWSGFLDLIKKGRPRQPVNGVLVTVSVTDLLTRTAPERAKQAAAVRARVQELHQQLGIRFPIYLMVTKCDLLAGFMDYLGDASKEQRADPWGFTFPLDAQLRNDIGADIGKLAAEFDRLEQRLTDGLIDRLQLERDPARRARIYAFPQQFAGLRGVLTEFVEKVFSPSQFEERPLLRGCYFISGTQEGTPIDRMLGAIARTYRLARTPLPANQATGKSFFLSRLLRDVVFAEADLAGTNLKWERRRSLLAWGGYALIALVSGAALTAWGVSYVNNKKYVADVAARVDAVRQLVQATPNRASSDLTVLLPALAATKALAVADPQRSVPWTLGFGLYQGRKLDSATQVVYQRMLVDAVQPRLALRVEDQLKSTTDDPELQYEVLKTYVMLHDPDHFDRDALKSYVTADWEVNLSRDVGTDDRAALESHLDALLAQGATVSPLPEDKQLVELTRQRLAQMPLAQRVYSRIRRDGVGADIPEFSIARAAGPAAQLVFTRAGKEKSLGRGVPGLYTYDGYYKGFQKVVGETTKQLRDEESWVLGIHDASRTASLRDPLALGRLTDDVRRSYLQDYVRQWETFIADIKLQPVANLTQAMQLARILSAPDNPLAPLMRGIVRETTLTAADSKSAVDKVEDAARQKIDESREKLARMLGTKGAPNGLAPGARIESIVDDRFESLRNYVKAPQGGGAAPIDATIALINEVYQLLSTIDTAVKGGNAPPPSEVPNKVKAEAPRLPEPVRTLVATLSASSNTVATGAARANLASSVNSSIGEFCRQAINGRYPFARNSTSDVTQEDFGRLFKPGGLFDEFFQKNLAALVDTNTRPWTFRQLGEGAITRDSATLAQFQRAAAIRDTFFRSGGATPSLRLEFKPQEMDETITQFTLDFDGQIVKYAHGPQIPTAIQWPGPKGSTQVRVQLQPPLASGSSGMTTEGPWALFRLFDKLQLVQAGAPERFRATFMIDGRKATFEVTASSVVNPFKLRELNEFACPHSL
ncbi:MAG TPA: type VI secretion system membrane subunit TssM [Burkholderiaceae bacterium]